MNHRLLRSAANQRTPMAFWSLFGLLCVVIVFAAAPAFAAEPSSVTLSSFTAQTQGNTIVVTWVTETENDIYNFILYRNTSAQEAQPSATVCTRPPQGSGISGATYNCTDDLPGLTPGTAYYYWLAEFNANGQPIFHRTETPTYFQGTPTATPTVPPDATSTPTPTLTPTSEFTATPTPTATVTATRIPTQAVTNTPTTAAATNTPTTPPTNTPIPPPTNTPIPPTAIPTTPAVPATNTPVRVTPTAAAASPTAVATLTPAPGITATPTATFLPNQPTPTLTPTETISATATLPSEPPTAAPAGGTAEAPLPGTPTRLAPRVRPDATATPGVNGAARNTAATGLLLCLGGGAVVGAGLLGILGFVLWRRQSASKNDPSS